MNTSNNRGKTTPNSTAGSFTAKAGRASRTAPDNDMSHADTQCENCGLDVFFDNDDRIWRHAESEAEGCGSHAPDGDDGTSATPRHPTDHIRPPRRLRPVAGRAGVTKYTS